MSGLNLDLSMTREGFEAMNSTYRAEGLSVGSDHMRLFGEEIQMEVNFSDLILGNRLGQGACSAVNLARHRRTGEMYAVKMFNAYDKGQASQLYNELLLLTSFQCDALISLKGAFHDEGAIGVIIEYMDRGSLEFLTKEGVDVNEQVMAAIAFQIIWGLGYLHYEKQIHRDVKPGNILMNSLGQVKLSDFGISKELDNQAAMMLTSVGSYRYMSPERLRGEKYDATGDIWSVGITILELWNKKYPFSTIADSPISLLGELENLSWERKLAPCGFSRHMADCLLSMLEMEPSRRITSERLMGCPWFEFCGVNSLVDAHRIVECWLRDLDRNSQQQLRTTGAAGNFNLSSSQSLSASMSKQQGRPPTHTTHAGPGGGIPLGMSGSLSSAHSGQSGHSLHQRGGGAGVGAGSSNSLNRRDENEMSISIESNRGGAGLSFQGDESMSASRDKLAVSNNPYTSSGNLASSLSMAERYRSAYQIGRAPTEDEYDDDFEGEDEAVPIDEREYDYKMDEKRRDSGRARRGQHK